MGNIRLGNLTVPQIEERLGIEFPEHIREFMENTHQNNASDIQKGKWHCFDMPFELVCGDMETATIIYKSVEKKSKECKTRLQFSVQN